MSVEGKNSIFHGFSLKDFLGEWALLFCGTLGGPLCVYTAYGIPYSKAALIWAAVLIAGYMTLLFSLPRLGAYLVIPFGVAVIYGSIRRWESLYQGALLVIRTIQGYFAGTMTFIPAPGAIPVEAGMESETATCFCISVMVVLCLFLAWSLVASESPLLPAVLPLPLLSLSFIYTDLPPDWFPLSLLLLYLGGVLLTGGLRRHAPEKQGGVALLGIGAGLLALLLLLNLFPEENFTPQTAAEQQAKLEEQVNGIVDRLKKAFEKDVPDSENLSAEGERLAEGEYVLAVKSEVEGKLYLRGSSLGHYDGDSWDMGEEYTGEFRSLLLLGERLSDKKSHTLTVESQSGSLLYTPYGFQEPKNGAVFENYVSSSSAKTYSFTYVDPANYIAALRSNGSYSALEEEYEYWAQEAYTKLEANEKAALLTIAENAGIFSGGDPYDTALKVASYIKNAAEYTLEPGKTPQDQDFVLYFLLESKQGYCVHFASAAAAMLQALEIPARFVTGYAVNIEQAGVWTAVTDENAHAWVEIYLSGTGWTPVEVTDSADNSPLTNQPAPSPETTPAPQSTATPEPSSSPEASLDGGTEPEASDTPAPEGSTIDAPTDSSLPGAATGEPPSSETTDSGSTAEETPKKKVSPLWLLLLLPPLLGFGYYKLRDFILRRRAEKLQKPGKKNALLCWQYLKKLQRWGAHGSERAEEIAERITFSNHPLSEEEQKYLLETIEKAQRTLQAKLPKWKILYLRYILFLW